MRLFLKKFLVLILILSISIPSFSAVSVSDGSTFVSKAEHTVDYNNLSNRVSYLENSLDAKIDALVTSYLSRNGIWNGEVQSLQNNSISGSASNALWGALWGGSSTKRNIVSSISKSGLAFIYVVLNAYQSTFAGGQQYSYDMSNGTEMKSYIVAIARAGYSDSFDFYCSNSSSSSSQVGDITKIKGIVDVKFNYIADGSNYKKYYVVGYSYPSYSSCTQLFVSKGQSLWWGYTGTYIQGVYSSDIKTQASNPVFIIAAYNDITTTVYTYISKVIVY